MVGIRGSNKSAGAQRHGLSAADWRRFEPLMPSRALTQRLRQQAARALRPPPPADGLRAEPWRVEQARRPARADGAGAASRPSSRSSGRRGGRGSWTGTSTAKGMSPSGSSAASRNTAASRPLRQAGRQLSCICPARRHQALALKTDPSAADEPRLLTRARRRVPALGLTMGCAHLAITGWASANRGGICSSPPVEADSAATVGSTGDRAAYSP